MPARPTDLFAEVGSSGLYAPAGYVQEEPLRELQGPKWQRALREMVANDALIHGCLLAIEMLVRRVTWTIQPASEAPEDLARAEFIRGALFDDMAYTWADTLAEILSFLPWGWAYFEVVYKRRAGDSRDPSRASRFTDGKIGWRKWAIRAQESLQRWAFDESGGTQGMWQLAPPTYTPTLIPIDKALLFRTTVHKGNPEGLSVLRSAYTSWFYKSRIQRIEGIGIERDLAGLPVVWVPGELLSASATPEQKQQVTAFEQLVRRVRVDEQMGLVLPLVYDDNGNPKYKFELAASPGRRQFDINLIVTRYDQRIAVSMLADFLLLGSTKVGSFALSVDKTQLFSTALQAWLMMLADVVNRFAIPPLLAVNGMGQGPAPRLEATPIESTDWTAAVSAVVELVKAGVVAPNPALATFLLQQLELPVPDVAAEGEAAPAVADAGAEEAAAAPADTGPPPARTAAEPAVRLDATDQQAARAYYAALLHGTPHAGLLDATATNGHR